MKNKEVVTEGKRLDQLKKMGIVAGMSLLGGGVGIARHNTYSPPTGTQIVDGSAIPAGVAGLGGGGLLGHLMAGQMVASSNRNRDLKKHLKKSKETRDNMKNEEYTQILEQMILTLTGMELKELHEAVGGHLTEMPQTRGRYLSLSKSRDDQPFDDLKRDVQGRIERAGKSVIGRGGRVLARSAAAYYKKYPRARGTLHDPSTAGDDLSEDYQTPARNDQMQDMYDRAEGAFFKDLSSDKLLRKVWAIDNKSQKEMRSPRLYGKNGKIIKQTKKKKRVRVGQPGGRQGGYQGGNQIGNGRGGYQGGNQIGNV